MYSTATSLSESQKLLQPAADVDAEELEHEDDQRDADEPGDDLRQPAAARVVLERRDGTGNRRHDDAPVREWRRELQATAHGEHPDVHLGRQLGGVLREGLGGRTEEPRPRA